MSKLKQIGIKIKDQLFQVKAEELDGRIWFHWNGKIFILYLTGIEKKRNFRDSFSLGASVSLSDINRIGINQTDIALIEPSDHKTTPINNKKPDKYVILSPMPGEIVKILVHPGVEVTENQTVLILSSMKMEYTLKASAKGVIKSVKVKEGEKVSADQELVEMAKSSET
ncbi:MAG: acetyl-CoA carboxylase biotin carboxyl carrier protein subunit [Bdellovibrionales bacterium]|nr:acetyl-CoA carboxylase biotin carboxyl carrier protein subunit [Bdellovibrionales bacterium]